MTPRGASRPEPLSPPNRSRPGPSRSVVPGGEDSEGSEDSDESWYRHELVGLRALSVSGEDLGEVTDLEPGVAQDRLVVTTPEGDDVAVPFVAALVPAIDPEAGTVTLAPPGGLFPGRGEVEEAR